MISLGRYLGIGTTDSETESFALEGAFLSHLRSYQVLLQTGSSSHFPFAGWFRLTFSRTPQYMEVALSRLDNALKNWRPPKIVLSRFSDNLASAH
ncbi:hypothetical protein BKA70DRAFT_597897 [Coprinopsis sp. MPI-PUGE-AT-0042]|nr:hypothetical protein BKA70DRAFT_597897 [Coprinopsis sp. MPI-PUGE-AT-0042]